MILLPRDTRMGELGEGVSNLSGAAGTGLGYLIASKVAQVRARNAFESFGMDRQQADALSRLPIAQRNSMLNDLAERRGYTEVSRSTQVPTFGQAIGQTSPQAQQRFAALAAIQAMPQQQPMQPMQAQPITSPMLQAQQGAQIPLQQAQAQMATGGPRGMMQGADQGLQALQQARQQGLLGYQPQQQPQQPAQLSIQPPRQPGEAPRPVAQPGQAPVLPSEEFIPGLRQALRQPLMQQESLLSGPSPKLRAQQRREAREEEKLDIAKQKLAYQMEKDRRQLEQKEQTEANKETKEYYSTVLNQHKGLQENKVRLKKMEKLLDEGNLPNPKLYKFLKSVEETSSEKAALGLGTLAYQVFGPYGAAVGGLLGAFIKPLASAARVKLAENQKNTEEFEKLSADFVKSAKVFFGSRLTDADLNAYMQTVPTLIQTDNGKRAVIKNIREMMRLQDLEYEAMQYIIKNNNGKRPADLQAQVAYFIDPAIDKLTENIKAVVANNESPQPRSQLSFTGRRKPVF